VEWRNRQYQDQLQLAVVVKHWVWSALVHCQAGAAAAVAAVAAVAAAAAAEAAAREVHNVIVLLYSSE
jgi:hypothetical protein